MKLTGKLFAVALLFSAGSAFAAHTNDNSVGYERTKGAPMEWSDEYVYLNSPSDYDGPGEISWCRKVGTYSGGPKTGTWRTYFVCKVK